MKHVKFIAVLIMLFMLPCVSCAAVNDLDVYDSEPSYTAPYYSGIVKSSVLNEALDELNYIREIAGLPSNITLDDEYTSKAQHGAVLLDIVDTLSHTPSKPDNMTQEFYDPAYDAANHSNLAVGKLFVDGKTFGNMSLIGSLKLCMKDSDSKNIGIAGHRRSLMNPRLKRVGFGLSTRYGYAVTYAVNEFSKTGALTPKEYKQYLEWLKWPIDDEFITWPSRKNPHPLDYFDSETSWSVILNPEIFDSCNDKAVKVTLTRQSDNYSWTFTKAGSNQDSYFNITNGNSGSDQCIIFRPDNVSGYSDGETWDVNITGLTRKDGASGSISYSVTFAGADSDSDSESDSITDYDY